MNNLPALAKLWGTRIASNCLICWRKGNVPWRRWPKKPRCRLPMLRNISRFCARRAWSRRVAQVSVYYRLASESVSQLWLTLRACGEQHLAEVDHLVATFRLDRAAFQPITVDKLREALQEDRAILLDVRPAVEYMAGHLPLARSIPVAELELRLQELPQDQEIVAYCRGPYCVFADEAVTLLRTRGYQARRLEEGVLEWRTRGLPIAIGKETEG